VAAVAAQLRPAQHVLKHVDRAVVAAARRGRQAVRVRRRGARGCGGGRVLCAQQRLLRQPRASAGRAVAASANATRAAGRGARRGGGRGAFA
jgi:hypothetical protein